MVIEDILPLIDEYINIIVTVENYDEIIAQYDGRNSLPVKLNEAEILSISLGCLYDNPTYPAIAIEVDEYWREEINR